MCIKFPAAVVGSAEGGGGLRTSFSHTTKYLARGIWGPAEFTSAQRSCTGQEVPGEWPALREILVSKPRNRIGWGPVSDPWVMSRQQGSGRAAGSDAHPRGSTPRPFGVRKDTGPHRRATHIHFTHLVGRRSSAGGPIAERKRSSSFLATGSAMRRILAHSSSFRGGAPTFPSPALPGRRRMRNLAGRKSRTGPAFGTGGPRTGKRRGRAWGHAAGPSRGTGLSWALCPQARSSINAGSPHKGTR